MKKINLRISELRHKKKITQHELADVVGVSFQTISKWENGSVMPDITYLPMLAEYFEVSVDQLIGIVPLSEETYSARATIALLKDIDSELQSEFGETIPEQDIIKYICRGSRDTAPNNPYEEIMQRCLCRYAGYIFTRLKEWGINTNYSTICFLGGGGKIIQSFGNYGSNIYFCKDMKINAKGYEYFEKALAMKQR